MSKTIYLGAAGLACKVKRFYLGVGGAARKIKRAYVGVADKAATCYRAGGYQYYGAIGSLREHRWSYVACSTGETGIFAAGYNNSGKPTTSIEAYNDTLTAQTTDFPMEMDQPACGSCDGYALVFGGNYGYEKNTRIVCIPDTLELTYSYAWPSSVYTRQACISNGVHGIGGLGNYASASCTRVGAASRDCTFTELTAPPSTALPSIGLRFGNRAMFLRTGKNIYTYDQNLVLQTAAMSDGDVDARATVGEKYFVFSSGLDYSQNGNQLDRIQGIAYDRDLVRLTPVELYSANKSYRCAASADSYALLACHGNYVSPNQMHRVDDNLVFTKMDNPMRAGELGSDYASVRAGEYVLVMDSTGGYGSDTLHAFID
ncbi:MAG: hypothetical protein RR296_06560 [Clostridia bacterium]